MKKYILFFLLFLVKYSKEVKNDFPLGIYNLALKNKKFLVHENNKIKIKFTEKSKNEAHFRIVKLPNNKYNIENDEGNLKLYANFEKLELSPFEDLKNKETLEWSFIGLNDSKFIIQNKNGCYITLRSNQILCRYINIKKAIKFNITKLFEGVNNSEEDIKLIEKEPIDILINYFDLENPSLKRDKVSGIVRDESNDELKYSIRSIFKNIPWARKIFILMPNEKINFFKEYELIKKKIIYVYYKDLLGFSPPSLMSLQFRIWMMEKYYMSKNFILINDNNFIGQPLKKSDFFYVRNGQVSPLIITNSFEEVNINLVKNNLINLKKEMEISKSPYLKYSIQNTYLFILKLFNKDLIFPKINNNVLPCNLREVKEIFNLILKSGYRFNTLHSFSKDNESLHFQTFYLGYSFNEYNKKINKIPFKIFDMDDGLKIFYDYPLFCINKNYIKFSPIASKKSKLMLEYHFPEPTPYEKIDSIFLPNLSYNIINEIEKEKNLLNQKYTNFVKGMEMIVLILLYLIYKKNQFLYKTKNLQNKNKEINFINLQMSK